MSSFNFFNFLALFCSFVSFLASLASWCFLEYRNIKTHNNKYSAVTAVHSQLPPKPPFVHYSVEELYHDLQVKEWVLHVDSFHSCTPLAQYITQKGIGWTDEQWWAHSCTYTQMYYMSTWYVWILSYTHFCLSATWALTWASTLVGSCTASLPSTLIKLDIFTFGSGLGISPNWIISCFSFSSSRLRCLRSFLRS